MAPIVYFLGGVLVRATTKAIRDRLIAQGFRKATKGQIDSKIPTVTGTENNLISLITRAKNAIKSESPVASSGRNTARRKKPEEGNLIGNRGQSEFARKYGSRKMGGFGPVKSTRVKEAKDLKLAQAKRAKAKAESSAKPVSARPGNYRTGRQDKVNPATATIAGLVAAGAIDKVAYEAYVADNSPTVTQIEAAKKQIRAAAKTEKRNLENKRGFKPKVKNYQSDAQDMVDARYTGSGVLTLTDKQRRELKKDLAEITRKKPVRPKLRPKVVEAKPMSLGSYLNAEIKSRKSTVAKEKAKARKGDYKSIAEAKKAKSLYYIKDGKPMAAVYKRDLKGL